MEYIRCPKCEGETPTLLSRCRNCGERLPQQVVIEEINELKVRNGFVSFWLWACLIINMLFTLGYVALLFSSNGLWTGTPEPLSLRLFWILASLVIVAGYWLLISWKKAGFYVLSGTAIINGVAGFCLGPSTVTLITSIAPLFVLYLILQIPRKGKSCWGQLS